MLSFDWNIGTQSPLSAAIGGILAVLLLSLVVISRRQRGPNDIALLKGPAPSSWFVGSWREYNAQAPGIVSRAWAKKFGQAFGMKGIFREDVLIVSDIGALNHIFNANPTNYDLPDERMVGFKALWDRNTVVTVRKDDHARHRRVLQPAFGPVAVKNMKHVFDRSATMLVEKLDEMLPSKNKAVTSAIATEGVDMGKQLRYTTLDVIWLAGFGTDLGSVANPDSPHVAPYLGVEPGMFLPAVSRSQIIIRDLFATFPEYVQKIAIKLDRKHAKAALESSAHTFRIAKRLIGDKVQNIAQGEDPGNDVLGRLVQANSDKNSKSRLDDEEMEGSVGILHIAGHESSSNALGWLFYVLSKHQQAQHDLRKEIVTALEGCAGDSLSQEELEALPLLNAIIKETFRTHTAGPALPRIALGNDVIPLSDPVVLRDGTTRKSVAIRKGTKVEINVSAVHYSTDTWGADADEWKPERWLDGRYTKDTAKIPGLFANLLTFAAGPRGCIGWRFALLEIQVVLTRLLANYHFEPVPGVEIESILGFVDTVSVAGDPKGFGKLPLLVKRV